MGLRTSSISYGYRAFVQNSWLQLLRRHRVDDPYLTTQLLPGKVISSCTEKDYGRY